MRTFRYFFCGYKGLKSPSPKYAKMDLGSFNQRQKANIDCFQLISWKTCKVCESGAFLACFVCLSSALLIQRNIWTIHLIALDPDWRWIHQQSKINQQLKISINHKPRECSSCPTIKRISFNKNTESWK